jgi:hypothetical protein
MENPFQSRDARASSSAALIAKACLYHQQAQREPLALAPLHRAWHTGKFPDTYLECFLWSCNLLVCRMTWKRKRGCVCVCCVPGRRVPRHWLPRLSSASNQCRSLWCVCWRKETLFGAAQPNGKSHQSGKSCEHTAQRLMTGQRIFRVFTFIGFWQFGWR